MSDRWADFQKAKAEILAAHGLSRAEWAVLNILRLEVPLRPDELARYLVGYMEGFKDCQFTAAEYRRAMDSLVDKGLLYVLAFADAVSPAPFYSAWDDALIDGFEGGLDFTPAGFELMQEISAAYEAQYGRPFWNKKPPTD
jgi:hypothetical protein